MRPLKICIDARLMSGEVGGIEQFIIGLASGLSKLEDGLEEYYFLVYPNSKDWLVPYLGGSCQTLDDLPPPEKPVGKQIVMRGIPGFSTLWQAIDPRIFPGSLSQPKSSGIIEKAGVDVMHFTLQTAFLTGIPSIYHPHDLQYAHLPEMFTLRNRVQRDHMYRTFCDQARMVAVASNYVKRDLIQKFHLTEEKIKVIPLAPVIGTYSEPVSEDVDVLRRKYSLPVDFLFYPAQTWPHKNHISLLNSLAILRDRMGLRVEVVFSGRKSDFYPKIEAKIKQLGLEDRVAFLGFVSPKELRALYKLCRCVVIPTKFEAASFPLWEAFTAGVPAACSNVTSLPEQAGDAALLFDPDQPDEIARQIFRIWNDERLRADLVKKGKENVSLFTWDRTARAFRAHYRCIAGRPLTDEDRQILKSKSTF